MRKIYGSMVNGGSGQSDKMPKFPGRVVAVCVSLVAVFGAILAERCNCIPAMWAGYAVMVGGIGYIGYWFVKLGYRGRAIQLGIVTVLLGAMFGFMQYFMTQMNDAAATAGSEASSSLVAVASEWHAPLYSRTGIIIIVAAMVIRLALSFYRLYVSMHEGSEQAGRLRRRLMPVRIALIITIMIGLALVII